MAQDEIKEEVVSLYRKEDIESIIINAGIDQIYELYAEGKISLDKVIILLDSFLDSKGEPSPYILTNSITKDWKR